MFKQKRLATGSGLIGASVQSLHTSLRRIEGELRKKDAEARRKETLVSDLRSIRAN